jgi:hypothetical protein
MHGDSQYYIMFGEWVRSTTSFSDWGMIFGQRWIPLCIFVNSILLVLDLCELLDITTLLELGTQASISQHLQ